MSDARFMARAIRLAERGLYTAKPNPRVGCVIVKNGQIIAEGWHQQAGGPHAEASALQHAGTEAMGATAYVSLEPCNHHGRTPPCSQALIDAGIKRVVYAVADLGPASGGAQRLSQAGVQVECGLLEDEARGLNPGFHRRCAGGLPWVRLKLAMSLDGRAALPDGRSQWITGADARRDGHRWRARSDAILTGIGTVLADDPQMTARLEADVVQPLRVVVDTQARLPKTARLTADQHYLLAHSAACQHEQGMSVESDQDGGLQLRAVLTGLAQRGINELLVEAGPRLSGAFIRHGLVDELIAYQAAKFLGQGLPAAEMGLLADLDQSSHWKLADVRRVGDDLRIIAHPAKES